MTTATRILRRFSANETGATSIEYAVIAATLSISILIVVASIGTTLDAFFASIIPGFN